MKWSILLISNLTGLANSLFESKRWPLRYDELGLPFIDVKIASRVYPLMLDTGSELGLHLYEEHVAELINGETIPI